MFQLSEEEFREAAGVLQELLRIDTTNPPGNERPAAEFVARVLAQDGIQSEIVEAAPGRANLVARLRGSGRERPMLLSSHLDVVPAEGGTWKHPPFSGVEAEGCIWGRGAIDMKGMAIMALTVMRLLKRNAIPLKRDIIFAALADEETGCANGSAFMVKRCRNLVDAEYVINEVGGFNFDVKGRRFYPVQVGEKGVAWLRIRFSGEPGHGSLPAPHSCLAKLGNALTRLAGSRLPLHPAPEAVRFLDGMRSKLGLAERFGMRLLKNPVTGGFVLDNLVGDPGQKALLQAALCNTVNPTIVTAGLKVNVVPAEAVLEVDGRILPGQTAANLVAEVRKVIGGDGEIEVVQEASGSVNPIDTPLFAEMVRVLSERDPEGTVLPYLVPGFTDSRYYREMGAICYGFYPLRLPAGMIFSKLFHGIDERIPLEAFRFGIEALYDLVTRFAGAANQIEPRV